ncbi:MAG: hypothetical protein RIS88_2649 [Pseudomonadota bacterium]|jgi:hypothetical protein
MSNLPLSAPGGARGSRGVVCLGIAILALATSAGSATARAACPQELPAVTVWSDREASLRTQEQLSDACLKRLVRQCDADAEAGFLDGSSAATCSVRYEALLRQGFRGDFNAFLRWWQTAPPIASQ